MTLQSKVLRGSVWVVAFRWFARFLGLINVAIVARILGPEDFGLVAMAMLVLGLIEAWLAFGAPFPRTLSVLGAAELDR